LTIQDAEHPYDSSREDAKLLGLDARVACDPGTREDPLEHVEEMAFIFMWNGILQ